jgi:hypothetical protein
MPLYSVSQKRGWRARFAEARVFDPLPRSALGRSCDTCYQVDLVHRKQPCEIAWEPGSDVVPDLIHWGTELIVTDRVKVALEDAGMRGYVAWPVKIRERSTPKKRHRWPIVPAPYPGPPLWDLYPEQFCHAIPDGRTLIREPDCPECGRTRYDVRGGLGEQHFLIDGSTWDGGDLVLAYEVMGLFVTERVIDVIKQHNFTNIEFWKSGEIVSAATN